MNTASAPLLARVSGIGRGAGAEHRAAPRRQWSVRNRAPN
ncbi:MAG: helix-hairpin-helix domain-containing protein [Rhodopseudomonas palustris]|nr:helix-hairpin-helix domain-containing protein [Rhodopseudomonas palustris]